MIVSGGENVFPQEVENLLAERGDVSDVAVVGVDDNEFGKRLRAFVVPTFGGSQDADEIRQYVKANQRATRCPTMWSSSTNSPATLPVNCFDAS